jgi:predicted DsbA family dithiol-disulfide isomerase
MTLETIDVFADVVCPFTHVGLRRFVARRGELGSSVPLLRVRAWPLELVNGHPFDPESVAHHVHELRRQVAPELFARFTPDAVPATSMPAFALVADAYAVGDALGEAVSLAVRSALFEEGRDVADPAVIADVAAAHGIDRRSADAEQRVAADYEEGRRRGVEGSPEFFLGDRSYFCPGLRIDRTGDDMVIEPDVTRFDAFLEDSFAS